MDQSLSNASQYLNIAGFSEIQLFKKSLTPSALKKFLKNSKVWMVVHIYDSYQHTVNIFARKREAEEYAVALIEEELQAGIDTAIGHYSRRITAEPDIQKKLELFNNEFGFDHGSNIELSPIKIA